MAANLPIGSGVNLVQVAHRNALSNTATCPERLGKSLQNFFAKRADFPRFKRKAAVTVSVIRAKAN
jgi:hypothetical protein